MDAELQKDIEFAEAVNDENVKNQGLALASMNTDAFRSYISETHIFKSFTSPEAWFAARPQKAAIIRGIREKYEQAIAEEVAESEEAENDVAKELESLRATVAALGKSIAAGTTEAKADTADNEPEGEEPAAAEEEAETEEA